MSPRSVARWKNIYENENHVHPSPTFRVSIKTRGCVSKRLRTAGVRQLRWLPRLPVPTPRRFSGCLQPFERGFAAAGESSLVWSRRGRSSRLKQRL